MRGNHTLCVALNQFGWLNPDFATSKPITAEEGVKVGLVNAVVPPQELLKVSRMWALDIAEGRKPLVRSLHVTDKLGSLSESRAFLKVERQKAEHNARKQGCLDAIEEGIVHGDTLDS
ncbi:Peroxisomal fatty acid beta-oxidation multifunctional protein AIM1 [Bienertia sinuspersici]